MQCVKESVLERRGGECRSLATKWSPGVATAKLAATWASCRYDARLFDASLASRAVREAAAMGEACDCLSEHDLEAEEVVHTDDATQVHGGHTEAAVAELGLQDSSTLSYLYLLRRF